MRSQRAPAYSVASNQYQATNGSGQFRNTNDLGVSGYSANMNGGNSSNQKFNFKNKKQSSPRIIKNSGHPEEKDKVFQLQRQLTSNMKVHPNQGNTSN